MSEVTRKITPNRTTLGFWAICVVGLACNPQPLQENTHSKVQPAQVAKQSHTVEFQNVRFAVDPALAHEVKAETIPATTEGKPSDIWPEHSAFTLLGYPKLTERSSKIRIFDIAKFKDAMRVAGQESGRNTIPPSTEDWSLWVDEEVRVLRALLANKPGQGSIKSFIAKVSDPSIPTMGNKYPQMPFLPMWGATQAFVAHLKYINFKNGKGIFFLTQWNTETSQVTNDGLEYAFQGITDDGRYWVYAEFSVAADGLPRDSDAEVVAWNEKNYLLLHRSEKYQNYLKPVIARLEGLPANEFQPNLELLEKLIQSLDVRDK